MVPHLNYESEVFAFLFEIRLFCLRRDLLLLHTATLVTTKEITLTHTLIFDNAQISLSATKEHKTPAIYVFKTNIYSVF